MFSVYQDLKLLGQTDRQRDGRTEAQTDTDKQMDRHIDEGKTDIQTKIRIDGQTVG